MECAKKCFKLDIQKSALRGDAVLGWTLILKWNEIGRDGMLPPLFPAKRVT